MRRVVHRAIRCWAFGAKGWLRVQMEMQRLVHQTIQAPFAIVMMKQSLILQVCFLTKILACLTNALTGRDRGPTAVSAGLFSQRVKPESSHKPHLTITHPSNAASNSSTPATDPFNGSRARRKARQEEERRLSTLEEAVYTILELLETQAIAHKQRHELVAPRLADADQALVDAAAHLLGERRTITRRKGKQRAG